MEAAQTNFNSRLHRMPTLRDRFEYQSYKPLTRQETRSADASFKGVRVYSTHKRGETGGTYVSREETTLLLEKLSFPAIRRYCIWR